MKCELRFYSSNGQSMWLEFLWGPRVNKGLKTYRSDKEYLLVRNATAKPRNHNGKLALQEKR